MGEGSKERTFISCNRLDVEGRKERRRKGSDGVSTYVDSSDGCLYYFTWHTELACEEKVRCF